MSLRPETSPLFLRKWHVQNMPPHFFLIQCCVGRVGELALFQHPSRKMRRFCPHIKAYQITMEARNPKCFFVQSCNHFLPFQTDLSQVFLGWVNCRILVDCIRKRQQPLSSRLLSGGPGFSAVQQQQKIQEGGRQRGKNKDRKPGSRETKSIVVGDLA